MEAGRTKWTDAHIDERFDQVDKRFDQVDARLERMQARMDERFDRLQIALLVTLGLILAAFLASH
ncbi:MAG TPA: hypothetical protein VGG40_12800 [Solirubrobacterales bacterium]|jgi:hypothetical protein